MILCILHMATMIPYKAYLYDNTRVPVVPSKPNHIPLFQECLVHITSYLQDMDSSEKYV